MTRRAVHTRNFAKVCAVAFAFLLLANTANAQKKAGFVSLVLTSVSAEREAVVSAGSNTATIPIWRYVDEVTFACSLKIDNETGADLVVQSTFVSPVAPFADLELVVTDLNGKVISQQPYSYIHSPYRREPRPVPLSRGETTTKLLFPIDGIDPKLKTVKVRLVGTFVGSAYTRICSSDTVAVSIEDSTREKLELPPQPVFPLFPFFF